jgi:cytochrome P450
VPRPAGSARRNARYTPLDADGPLPIKMVRSVPAIRRDPLTFLERLVARHGDLVAFPMPRGAVLLVNDPVAARQVLQDNHRNYSKQTVQYASLATVTGSGLLTADGEAWRARRRIVQPAFHHSSLDGVAAQAVLAGRRLRARWEAAPGRLLDADEATLRAMLEVVGHTLFGSDQFDAGLAAVGERIVGAVDDALAVVVRQAQSLVPASWPGPARRRLRRAVQVLDSGCADIVRARRERTATDAGAGSGRDTDVLGLLLRAADAGELTDREVRDELVTLVIAGHETVASALTWALYLLAEHPRWQHELAAELDQVLAGREPGWSDLPRLPLTRAVVDEALRLYPPAWVITRRAIGPDTLAGVALPAGTLVIISPWLLHRRPDSWPDPLRFDPGRFLHSGPGAPRGDYIPFGAGPRLCIGRDFALVEAVLVLATLLQGRRVTHPRAAPPVQVDALVTLRPRTGLPLQLDPPAGQLG